MSKHFRTLLNTTVVTSLAFAVAISACAGPSEPADPMAEQQREYFADLVAKAEEYGASSVQIEVLREAAASGELTTEMVTGLYDPMFECFEALGATGEVFGTNDIAPGVSVPDYRISYSAELAESGGAELDAQITTCQDIHAGFVWQALFLQPRVIEAQEQQALAMLPKIQECLAEVGVKLADDATSDQVQSAIDEGFELQKRCTPDAIEMGMTDPPS